MGNQTIRKINFEKILKEVNTHINRLEQSFNELSKELEFPLSDKSYEKIIQKPSLLAFADQIIYRFSKAQDTIGGKLFKAYLLVQGENIDKPFLDILNNLERISIVDVDKWFELREIRNEIAHDYEDNDEHGKDVLNTIYKHKKELSRIAESIKI